MQPLQDFIQKAIALFYPLAGDRQFLEKLTTLILSVRVLYLK
ncbi:MAG: hypothetical protein N2235_24055 [Fischerella sp.]|nr:hypothetical protein [Fischerella sp.]